MVFERLSGSRRQRLSTLEPRFMYLYVPYRNQDDLPVFDTGSCRPQPGAAVSHQSLRRRRPPERREPAQHRRHLAAARRATPASSSSRGTIGQAYYFDEPRVALPGEVLEDPEFSDIIAELDVTAYGDWNISMGMQWDPGETRSEKGDVQLQYKPEFDRVVNVGYRFRRGNIEQVDGSVAWPIGNNWSAYARMVYSLRGHSTVASTSSRASSTAPAAGGSAPSRAAT